MSIAAAAPAPTSSLEASPPRAGAWAALAILTLINLFNYIDRLVLPAVLESIRASELHPTDTELGFLATAFLVVYMLSAPAIGVAADRGARPRLLGIGVALWSIATALGGVARSYEQLLAARAAVGIGEAAYGTIAPALLADFFPEHLRGRVFAVFFMATPVGSALGYVLGGLVDKHYGWRSAFFVAGLPGLLLALLAFSIRDPARRDEGAPTSPVAGDRSARARVLGRFAPYATLLRNRPYTLTILGYAAYTFALGGIAFWMPAFLERIRNVPRAAANTQLGAVLVVTGFVGTFAGGWIADRLLRRTREAYLWLSGVTAIAAAPLALVALSTANLTGYWVSLVLAELLLFASTGPINSAIVSKVPPTMRAAAMALCILVIHLLGDVPSPPLIGFISDYSSLARGVMIIPLAVLIGGAIWVYAAARGEREAAT